MVNGHDVMTTDDPGCFWHGAEPITESTFLVCYECGHVYETPADLERVARKTHDAADINFIKLGYAPSPFTEPFDANTWPHCPLCCHDL